MKTQIITLIGTVASLLLPACTDPSVKSESSGNESSIVLPQPKSKESIPPVVETLRQSLVRVAEASSGARVPCPQISILRPDGKITTVQAPKVESGLFGSANPKARCARLEGLLAALEKQLVAGCGGESVGIQLLKDHQTSGLRPGPFSVWAAGGGDNPWTAEEAGPEAFIEDRATFADKLSSSQGKGGNFLVVSDPMPDNSFKSKRKTLTVGPTANATIEPAQSIQVAPATPAQPSQATAVERRGGDTIIVDVKNYPSNRNDPKNDSKREVDEKLDSSIALPQGVAPVGDAITFATNSAKPTSDGIAAVKRAADILKKRADSGRLRLFLVAKADSRSTEGHNERLSQKRAEAVQAALMAEGISIEKIIAIGESLSPDSIDKKELAAQRSVQLWALPEEGVALGNPSSVTQRKN